MKLNVKLLLALLIILLICSCVISIGAGVVKISPWSIIGILADKTGINSGIAYTDQEASVLTAIRLPRLLYGLLIGAGLGMTGAAIQGIFRNPLAEPGLIGVSSGATFAAVFTIVTGHFFLKQVSSVLGFYMLPTFSFIGALVATIFVYRISQSGGKTIVSILLLAGIAINALATALTGFFIFYANDAQLRSIVFWTLGSLGGATWSGLISILPFILIPLVLLPGSAKALNLFSLGESNANQLGVNTDKVKRNVVLLSAMAVGASVAVSGIIGFVGLVTPHIMRMVAGPDHRHLLVLSGLSGAILLILADVVSRTMFNKAEMPIGVITSLIGAPFFLYILLKEKKLQKVY